MSAMLSVSLEMKPSTDPVPYWILKSAADGLKGGRVARIEAVVKVAREGDALCTWHPEIGTARVQDNGKVLHRRSQAYLTKVLNVHVVGEWQRRA